MRLDWSSLRMKVAKTLRFPNHHSKVFSRPKSNSVRPHMGWTKVNRTRSSASYRVPNLLSLKQGRAYLIWTELKLGSKASLLFTFASWIQRWNLIATRQVECATHQKFVRSLAYCICFERKGTAFEPVPAALWLLGRDALVSLAFKVLK